MKIPIYRPAPTPDVNTEEAGIVWYYLTDAGMKLDPTAYLYRRHVDASDHVLHTYGGESRGYIFHDDTARSWENVSVRIEEDLSAHGFVVMDRPAHLLVVRNEDGGVRGETLTDVYVRHAAGIIGSARDAVAAVEGGGGWKVGGREFTVAQLADVADALRRRLDERESWSRVAVMSNVSVDEYLRSVFPTLGEHYGMPVDGVRMIVEAHHEVSERLFGLLDDIDTLDDACRDNDAAFRKAVRAVQKRRFEFGDTDGYRVYWKHRGEKVPEHTAAVHAGDSEK